MTVLNIKKILVPLDFGDTSLKVLDYAVTIALKNNAEVILLHIAEDYYETLEHDYYVEHPNTPSLHGDFTSYDNMSKIVSDLKRKGVNKVTTLVGAGSIHTEILDEASRNSVDLIVMGTHSVSGTAEFLFGSNTFKVIRDSHCPVLSVQQNTGASAFRNILMPLRDKPYSLQNLNYAIDMAVMFSADLNILGIDTEFSQEHSNKMANELSEIKKAAEASGIKCTTKIISETYQGNVVLNYAHSINADIIISTADLEIMNLKEYFTGPFAQQIVNHSNIPVLSVTPNLIAENSNLQSLQTGL